MFLIDSELILMFDEAHYIYLYLQHDTSSQPRKLLETSQLQLTFNFPRAVRRPCDVKVAAAALGWSIGLCRCESFEKLL